MALTADSENALSAQQFSSLQLLFENKQNWVRHYETLLAQFNPLSTTVSLAVLAFIAQSGRENNTVFVALPICLSAFSIWFNVWCHIEIKNLFQQIVRIETALGFYDLSFSGQPLMDPKYKLSGAIMRPTIVSGIWIQVAALVTSLGLLFVRLP